MERPRKNYIHLETMMYRDIEGDNDKFTYIFYDIPSEIASRAITISKLQLQEGEHPIGMFQYSGKSNDSMGYFDGILAAAEYLQGIISRNGSEEQRTQIKNIIEYFTKIDNQNKQEEQQYNIDCANYEIAQLELKKVEAEEKLKILKGFAEKSKMEQ